ncbi:LysR family transcriptional regulator [Solimicrobium silvestre]|uniref:Transcriptional regulator n=1 Tax=Solimicrobium silvestre TaxID=2099400 RepID=A0A2S9H088_9BURK|nr:LysR family transcriptional regulator [Solimicrobium silvestre]PRC93399.1 Transcriptional regulator [Solimicrobium silvestre]
MRNSASEKFVRHYLKIKHLVLMVELGRHGSISRAAQSVHMTQSAVSKLLAEIEYALNVTLFERQPRGIFPTRYGEVMIRRAEAALNEMTVAQQEIDERRSGLCGRVALGTVLAPSISVVPRAIQILKQRYARINVSVTVDTSVQLLQKLRSAELDLVIGHQLNPDEEFTFEAIRDEPHSLFVRAGHPWLTHTDLSLKSLLEGSWILPSPGSILRARLTNLFLAQGLDCPSGTVETEDISLISVLLADSNMIVALPREAMRVYLDAGLLDELPFQLGIGLEAYGFMMRSRCRLSLSAELMLDALRASQAMRLMESPARTGLAPTFHFHIPTIS